MPSVTAARSTAEWVQEFLTSHHRASNHTKATSRISAFWLRRLAEAVPDVDSLDAATVARFFTALRDPDRPHPRYPERLSRLSDSTIHQAFRVVKTFSRWLRGRGAIARDVVDFTVKVHQARPEIPTAEHINAVLGLCALGKDDPHRVRLLKARNAAMILVMIDAGLRASELLRLIVRDWTPPRGGDPGELFVLRGKGQKDRVSYVGPLTARAIRQYLDIRGHAETIDPLFAGPGRRFISHRHLVQILHRLSTSTALTIPMPRLHPHLLRHLCATSKLRDGMGVGELQRMLGHESIQTTMRYVHLAGEDVKRAHKRAASVERMGIRYE